MIDLSFKLLDDIFICFAVVVPLLELPRRKVRECRKRQAHRLEDGPHSSKRRQMQHLPLIQVHLLLCKFQYVGGNPRCNWGRERRAREPYNFVIPDRLDGDAESRNGVFDGK